MEGVEQLLAQDVLSDFYQFKSKGSSFDSIENSGDRVAGFSIIANDWQQMQRKHEQVLDTLKVIDINGEDMMHRDILTDLYT